MMRLSRDLMALTFFSQRLYVSSCILRDESEALFVTEGSGGSVPGVAITMSVSPVAVSAVSEFPVAVAVAVGLTVVLGLMYSQTCS